MAFIYDLTDTWNAGGTTFNAIKMNVTDSASAAASKLVTLQVGGSERFGVRKDGQGYFAGNVGIGTSSPTSEIDVFKAKTGIVKVSVGNNVGAANDGARFNLNYSGTSIGSYGYVWDGGAFNNALDYYSTLAITQQGTERMRIDSTGNVILGADKFLNFGNQAQGVLGSSDGSFRAYTGYTERMRIDSAGNVGIGTGSPTQRLDVRGGDLQLSRAAAGVAGDAAINFGNSAANYIYSGNSSNIMAFAANGSERMRIDSSGRVGIGTSSPARKLFVTEAAGFPVAEFVSALSSSPATIDAGEVFALSGTSAVSGLTFTASDARLLTFGASPNNRAYMRARAFEITSIDETTIVTNSVERMRIDSIGNVGIGTSSPSAKLDISVGGSALRIRTDGSGIGKLQFTDSGATTDYAYLGTPAANTLAFWTSGSTERMRIDSGGNLLVGTTTLISGAKVSIDSGGGPSIGSKINTTSAAGHIIFENPNGAVGQIFTTGSATVYATSSDARLKHDIVDAPDAADLIDAIKVRSFKWNADNSEQRYGMVAQELLEVAPEAVSVPADEDDMMGVDYSKLVPMLIKEIQSLRARVAQLEGN